MNTLLVPVLRLELIQQTYFNNKFFQGIPNIFKILSEFFFFFFLI